MNESLKDKRAVVTGGAQGIGYAIAAGLRARGARVCVHVKSRTYEGVSGQCRHPLARDHSGKRLWCRTVAV